MWRGGGLLAVVYVSCGVSCGVTPRAHIRYAHVAGRKVGGSSCKLWCELW